MEGNSHKQENVDIHALHHTDEELENWTFVTSEDSIPLGKPGNAVNHEDLSDNGSEQGSDSGSSIVVIETTSYLKEDGHNLDITPSDQGDVPIESVKESEFTSSNNPIEEFTKEQSPFFVVGNPPLLGFSKEYSQDQSECPTSEVSEQVGATLPGSFQVEDAGTSHSNQTHHGTSQDHDDIIEEKLVNETNPSGMEESILNEDTDLTAELEENISCSAEEVNENQPAETEQEAPGLMASISSAEDLSEAVHVEEAEFLNDAEDEESDDENWDLGVEAPAYPVSLASSVSSLVDQPSASPSLAMLLGDGHVLVKPDLLEEANRIEELDQYDYSSVSNPDLPPELNVGAIMRERAYVHRPNQRLNVQLSYVLAFALAAVFGFALGNLIGLADNFPSRCASMRANSKASQPDNEWSEEQWRAEVQRLTALNEELMLSAERLAEELGDLTTQNSHFDHRLNELISENWDLKQSVGRIRYGKPVRSLEDRHTINILQTENQELRSTVGKLRYKCGQTLSLAEQQSLDSLGESVPYEEYVVPVTSGSLLELLGALNRTADWDKLVGSSEGSFTFEKLANLKDGATDLVELIGQRREELGNLTSDSNAQLAEKTRASLHKAASKVFNVMERLRTHQASWGEVIDEEQSRLDKIRSKVEKRWQHFLSPENCSNENCPLDVTSNAIGGEWSHGEGSQGFRKGTEERGWSLDKKADLRNNDLADNRESSVDPDWYLVMGKRREKIRRTEEKSEWLFERAKSRDNERRSRKYQQRKKVSKDGAWKQYSA